MCTCWVVSVQYKIQYHNSKNPRIQFNFSRSPGFLYQINQNLTQCHSLSSALSSECCTIIHNKTFVCAKGWKNYVRC